MPISNGANNWPRTYWSRPPKRPGVHTNVVVVDRPDPPPTKGSTGSRPASPVAAPSRPASSRPRPASSVSRIIVDDAPPSVPPPQTRYVTHGYVPPPRPPGYIVHDGPDVRYDMYTNGYGYVNREPSSSICCGNHLFGSGKAGGDTGCCQGGLMSRRRYPYIDGENYYRLPGDGRRRCCAIIWGIIVGLLLLGLLIGLLAGLMPALKKKKAQSSVQSQFPNGKLVNGIYYYPITNPPDVFYLDLGPGIPCDPSTSTAAAGVTQTTLPSCGSITTNYVPVAGVSVSTTTLSMNAQFPQSGVQQSRRFNHLLLVLSVSVVVALAGGS